MRLGLKGNTSLEQINDRLQYHPTVYEFHLTLADTTTAGLAHLRDMISYVKKQGIQRIVMHQPMKYNGFYMEVGISAQAYPEIYQLMWTSANRLLELAIDMDVQLLVHGSYSSPRSVLTAGYPGGLEETSQTLFKRLDDLAARGQDHIMFENSISPLFYYGDAAMDERILSHHYRLAFDTSHCFIKMHGDNQALLGSLKRLRDSVVHYHLVDSLGQRHDSLTLGTGRIQWAQVLPLLNPEATSIFEIVLADQTDAKEMMASYHYLQGVEQKLAQQ